MIARPHMPARGQGFALIAVLWMTVALSLLVATIVGATRTDTRDLQAAVARFDAVLAGDSAIALAMQHEAANPEGATGARQHTVAWRGTEVQVQVFPAEGFIDINTASEALLADLFAHAGQRPVAEAQALAREVVAWRERTPAQAGAPRPRTRFDVIDDLMQVAGMDYEIFAKIRSLITIYSGQPGVVLDAAPPEVLAVLAGGDVARARRFADQRGRGLVSTEGFSHGQSGTGSGRVFYARALVPDGAVVWQRSAWLRMDAAPGRPPLAWLETLPVTGVTPNNPW